MRMLGKTAHWNRGCCCCNPHGSNRYKEKLQWKNEAYNELQEEKEAAELEEFLNKPRGPQWVIDIINKNNKQIEEELNG